MSLSDDDRPDPDDLFAHTRMSLGDHIEELRTHLWRAIKGFLVAMVLGFFVANYLLQFIAAPVEKGLKEFRDRRVKRVKEELEKNMASEEIKKANEIQEVQRDVKLKPLAKALGLDDSKFTEDEYAPLIMRVRPVDEAILLTKAMELVGPAPTLKSLSITEAFVVWCKVAIYAGFVLASPWIFYQLWMFVAAGLYPHEKRYVHVYLPFSLGLFLAGVALCEFVVLPMGIKYLLEFNEWINVEPDLRLNEWLSFAIFMPLIFGLSFQTPLVMLFLERIGVFTWQTYLAYWRIAIFTLGVLAMVFSASPDPLSFAFMAVPMCGLYFLGIFLCYIQPRRGVDLEEPDPEELVEV
jgi:sec-independent protein translocase protein TatC